MAICACGCLLEYAHDTQKGGLPHVTSLQVEQREDGILLDAAIRRNPERVQPAERGASPFW